MDTHVWKEDQGEAQKFEGLSAALGGPGRAQPLRLGTEASPSGTQETAIPRERESNMNEGRERVEVMDNHRVYKGEGWEGRGQVREGLANLVRRGWKKRDEEGPTKI